MPAEATANSKLDSALDAAMESTVKDTADATAAETKTAATPPESETPETETSEPEAAAAPEDDEPDALSITPEQLTQIKANPELSKLYRGMNKAFTQKTMDLAQERKLIEALRDPETREGTFRAIAAALGKQVVDTLPQQATEARVDKKVDATVTANIDKLAQVFGPEAAEALRPILTETIKEQVAGLIASEVAPLREATGTLAQQAWAAQSEAEVKAFKSSHPGEVTTEVESKMAALFNKLPPSEDIEPGEYLEYLYRIVKGDIRKTEATKEVTTRMAKAAATQEPKPGVQAARVSSTSAPKSKDWNERWDQAFEEARDGR